MKKEGMCVWRELGIWMLLGILVFWRVGVFVCLVGILCRNVFVGCFSCYVIVNCFYGGLFFCSVSGGMYSLVFFVG